MNLDGLSLAPLVNELDSTLTGGRVDKIFQPDKYTIIIWLRQPGITRPLLISANPENPRLHLAQAVPENPPVPPVFAMLLRKHLEDGRIARICQHNLDRTVSIYIDVRAEHGLIVTKELIIELMGKHSNIILTQDGVITDAIRRVGPGMSRFRQVLPGRQFLPPPPQSGVNLFATESAAKILSTLLKESPADITLSKAIVQLTVGIGPVTAHEVVWRSGLPPDISIKVLDIADLTVLEEAIAKIIIPFKRGETQPTIVVAEDGSRIQGLAAFSLEHLSGQSRHFSTMSELIEFAASFKGRQDNPEKTLLIKLVSGEISRLKRKDGTLSQELIDAEEADSFRRNADILMAHLYVVEPKTPEVILPDLYATDPEIARTTIPLDPKLTPLQNAQHYYTKYNKLKRAQHSLTIQIQECQSEINYLDSILVALDHAVSLAEINEIRLELAEAGYIKITGKRRPAPLGAPLSATTPDGLSILIGKNNRQNDLVTFKQARSNDLWFHTKDIPGSHVILRSDNADPSPANLTLAATLAAYFSKARQSSNVPVDCTRRRYVKKPAGAKPGFVIYDHQKTIYVTPTKELVQTLLDK
ncbi:MAG: Fibronectin-binding domain protein [Firmicutes bacterium]|nr:Fibronectin-binding domain protein [Bacillota bacterium]